MPSDYDPNSEKAKALRPGAEVVAADMDDLEAETRLAGASGSSCDEFWSFRVRREGSEEHGRRGESRICNVIWSTSRTRASSVTGRQADGCFKKTTAYALDKAEADAAQGCRSRI